MFQIIETK
jgi:hypothetical protein